MNTEQYVRAAWKYWGIDVADFKPDASKLSDEDLFAVQHEKLPSQAYAEVMVEWERRRCRVKVYRDTSPKKR